MPCDQAGTYLGFFFSVFTKNSCKSIPVESVYSWLESIKRKHQHTQKMSCLQRDNQNRIRTECLSHILLLTLLDKSLFLVFSGWKANLMIAYRIQDERKANAFFQWLWPPFNTSGSHRLILWTCISQTGERESCSLSCSLRRRQLTAQRPEPAYYLPQIIQPMMVLKMNLSLFLFTL